MLLQIRKTWIGLLAWQIGMNLRNFCFFLWTGGRSPSNGLLTGGKHFVQKCIYLFLACLDFLHIGWRYLTLDGENIAFLMVDGLHYWDRHEAVPNVVLFQTSKHVYVIIVKPQGYLGIMKIPKESKWGHVTVGWKINGFTCTFFISLVLRHALQ